MLTKTLIATPDLPPADLVNRAEQIERRAAELEQRSSRTAAEQHRLDAEELQQRRAYRAHMLQVISDAHHMRTEQSRKLWVRRGIMFAGGFVVGLLLANASKQPSKAPLQSPKPKPYFNRRQMRWLAKRLRSRR